MSFLVLVLQLDAMSLARFCVCSCGRSLLRQRVPVFRSNHRQFSFFESVQNVAQSFFDSNLVYFSQEHIWLAFQESTGLPWWAVVCSLAAGTKLVTLPFFVKNQKTISKSVNYTVAFRAAIIKKMDESRECQFWTDKQRQKYMDENMRQGLPKVLHDVGGSKSGVITFGLVQGLIVVVCGAGLRHIVLSTPAMLHAPSRFPQEMLTEGLFWFTDLLSSDPLGIWGLPGIFAVLVAANTRVAYLSLLRSNVPFSALSARQIFMNAQPITRMALWSIVGIVLVPYFFVVPTCIPLYFNVYMFLSLLQSILFLHPNVKGLFGVLPMPYDTRMPLRKMLFLASKEKDPYAQAKQKPSANDSQLKKKNEKKIVP